jgi:small subunit ribosomal protein S14
MAKVGMIEREKKRERLAKKYANKRAKLLAVARDRSANPEEVFKANMKLAKLPRNSAPIRQQNRCKMTGRPRGVYRRFNLCRIELRRLASIGELPGVTKSSW